MRFFRSKSQGSKPPEGRIRKEHLLLAGIFALVLLLRLYLAFSTPAFTYDSYFHLRQAEHIREEGIPLYQDSLSYGGRELVFLPGFHYLLALLSLFLPLELAAKLFPNILLASLTLLAYAIARKVAQERTSALYSAGIAGFLPVLFSTNQAIPRSLFLPLLFLALYAFLNLPRKRFLYLYLGSFLLLCLTGTTAFVIIVGFLFYLLLLLVEKMEFRRAEVELIIFSIFFYLWSQFLFFKENLLREGPGFLWQNIPPQVIQRYFPSVSVLDALLLLGFIPLLAGIYIAYRSLFREKSHRSILLLGFALAVAFLAWFRLIPFMLALALLGIVTAVLFGVFFSDAKNFIRTTRLSRFSGWRIGAQLVLIALLASTMIPVALSTAGQQRMPTMEEIEAFRWLAGNTPRGARVAAAVEEGHLVTYYGKRANFMDDQFELIPNVEQRFRDLEELYTTNFQTQAIETYNKYGVQYVVLTPFARMRYGIPYLQYHSIRCFERIYKSETRIYRVKCALEETNGRPA